MLNDSLGAIQNWAIKRLGGITQDEHEAECLKHERWAMEYLTGKSGEVVPDCSFYFPYEGDDILVMRSKINISNARITGLKVAPWCREVVTSGLST